MAIQIDAKKCIDCGECVSACPLAALAFNDDNHVEVDVDYCITCFACASVCPCNAISEEDLL